MSISPYSPFSGSTPSPTENYSPPNNSSIGSPSMVLEERPFSLPPIEGKTVPVRVLDHSSRCGVTNFKDTSQINPNSNTQRKSIKLQPKISSIEESKDQITNSLNKTIQLATEALQPTSFFSTKKIEKPASPVKGDLRLIAAHRERNLVYLKTHFPSNTFADMQKLLR